MKEMLAARFGEKGGKVCGEGESHRKSSGGEASQGTCGQQGGRPFLRRPEWRSQEVFAASGFYTGL